MAVGKLTTMPRCSTPVPTRSDVSTKAYPVLSALGSGLTLPVAANRMAKHLRDEPHVGVSALSKGETLAKGAAGAVVLVRSRWMPLGRVTASAPRVESSDAFVS